MQTLTVELGERSYPIYIGQSLLEEKDLLCRHIRGKQALVVSNETVAPLYLDTVMANLSAYNSSSIVLPDGEKFKTLETLNSIFDKLLADRHNRTTTLIALGGGVIGDMTGFAAACYQRGVDFIQLPTTLLAQVDSSVGGKTAVNHALGKNMIGAFHQPNSVIIDTNTLKTLPPREYAAGVAEVIKYGLIADAEFFSWLQENIEALNARDADALSYAIGRSCQNKASIVSADERESGNRALLNLGHTFGHAIETATGYEDWLHGEAVAVGMLMAADLSLRMGWITRSDYEAIEALLRCAKLPVAAPEAMTREKFSELMQVDKKVIDGRLRLVLLRSIGHALVTAEFDHEKLNEVISAFCV